MVVVDINTLTQLFGILIITGFVAIYVGNIYHKNIKGVMSFYIIIQILMYLLIIWFFKAL